MDKLYKKKTAKTKEEWLELKRTTIGGSEAAMVVNKSKWGNQNDLYNKMVCKKERVVQENDRMVEGTKAEEHIRALFALDTKEFKIKNPPKRGYWFFYRIDKPYMSCTPDGLATNLTTGKLWGIEIKDVEMRRREEKQLWENSTLPDQYYFQLLQYLAVFNDMEGAVLIAHLKYFKHDEATDTWKFDYAVDRPFYLYRSDTKVTTHVAYLERKETEFIEENIKGHKRPSLKIKF